MTMSRLRLAAAAAGLGVAASPGHAQVIEIDPSGAAQTYSGPTLFTGAAAVPIRADRPRPTSGHSMPHLIARTARTYGLDPALLQAVAWQESRGNMRAVSVKGALGVMQLMPATAAELNVDPTDVEDNIRGGAIYLRRQLDRFGGSVPLALAAYNAGPGAVDRFGGIPPFRETQNYVAMILGRWKTVPTPPVPVLLSIEAPQ